MTSMSKKIQGLGKIESENVEKSNCISGLPSDDKVKKKVLALIDKIINEFKPSQIKIGKSGIFDNRKNAGVYAKFEKAEMIYSSQSSKNISTMEDICIKHAKTKHSKITANIRSGSAGGLSTTDKYYVYLAYY